MSGRIRIGIDVTSAVSQGGGIGRYTRELVRALVKTNDAFTYHLFSARQPSVSPVPNPVPSDRHVLYRQAPISERWLYRIWYRFRLPLPVQLVTGKIDLFHSPDFVLPAVKGDIPTLLTVHDLSFVHFPETFTPALVSYLNRVVPWSVKRARHILADSQATKDDLISIWDVLPQKVSVLYSGVARSFRPVTSAKQIAEVRQKYGLGGTPYLLSVSTVQPRKNYQMLVRSFQRVAAKHPHNLVIAGGKGWLYEQILAEIDGLSMSDRVLLIGYVDDADLPALYSDATLFLFPSLYEGFGLGLVEAMACGVPVLTSDASSLPEVAGEAALQLSPQDQGAWSDAMEGLLADATRRMKMVAAGFLQARRFTWQKAAQQLQGIYRQLLKA